MAKTFYGKPLPGQKPGDTLYEDSGEFAEEWAEVKRGADILRRKNDLEERKLEAQERGERGGLTMSQLVYGSWDGGSLLGALPERVVRTLMPTAEAFAKLQPKDSPFAKADIALLTNEWIRASTKLQLPGRFAASSREDHEILDKVSDALGGVTKAALAEGAAATGGNLVPTIVESEVVRLVRDASKLWPRARQ